MQKLKQTSQAKDTHNKSCRCGCSCSCSRGDSVVEPTIVIINLQNKIKAKINSLDHEKTEPSCSLATAAPIIHLN